MDGERERAEALLERARLGVSRLLPAGVVLNDAHTHLGLDEDGMALALPDAIAAMDEWDVSRALVFPLHEADRQPAYRAPNDRVLAWAAASEGRLVPLARLDLADDPIEEARRCLALGARGIKLHPRAQRFDVDDRRLEPVFALAEEHRLPVLIHAGRGMPPIGEHLARVSERHPGAILILAHAAIVDQARICDLVSGMANVFFDTSTWGTADLLGLLARVPPQQVLWATDVPYGHHASSIAVLATILAELGADDETRRAVFGGSFDGILEARLPTLTRPLAAPALTVGNDRLRVYSYLAAATPMLWLRQPDVIGLTGLAAGACDATDDPGLAAVGELVRAAGELWGAIGASPERHEVLAIFRLFQLAQVACLCPTAAQVLLCG
jgi:predicted TIM-barrel fold metal-dependent hydrolase